MRVGICECRGEMHLKDGVPYCPKCDKFKETKISKIIGWFKK